MTSHARHSHGFHSRRFIEGREAPLVRSPAVRRGTKVRLHPALFTHKISFTLQTCVLLALSFRGSYAAVAVRSGLATFPLCTASRVKGEPASRPARPAQASPGQPRPRPGQPNPRLPGQPALLAQPSQPSRPNPSPTQVQHRPGSTTSF